LKLTNYLQVKATNVFLTTIFKVGLLPYLKLIAVRMKINTLIEHKEVVVVCEESAPISLSYNVLLTTLEVNAIIKLVVLVVTAKSTLTCTNCGKIRHSVETYHKRTKEVPVMPTTIIKFIELITKTKTQLVKSGKTLAHYPCIICSNVEHRFGKCPRKIEVHNMFKIKHVSYNSMTTPKPPKIDNVLVNVVIDVTTCN